MSLSSPHPGTLPTLTDVVAASPTMTVAAPVDAAQPSAPAPDEASDDGPGPGAAAAAANESALVQAVLAGVQQRVNAVLEYRLREALAPSVARATQLVLADSQALLAAILREMVEEAVAQEMARQQRP